MAKPKKSGSVSGVKGVLRKVYIIVFAFSLVIVLGFLALTFLAPPPTVDMEVTFPPANDPSASSSAPSQGETFTSAPPEGAEPTPEPSQLVLTRREGVYTCLLIGYADMGGTDTIMLGVFDTKAKTASLISIPRDTVVNVDGKNRKINALHSVGGVELLTETVSSTLGIPVDFYMLVNTYAFTAIVNQIGGVWFDVPPGMDYEDPLQDLYIHIPEGYQLLNGEDALKVMRCRSAYVSQDIGRSQTQRRFLAALVKQTITISNVPNVTNLINILFKYVSTDMELSDMVFFATQAIGMDLDNDLTSGILPSEWIYPYIELDDDGVLELVNSLGIYEQEVPMEALNIYHP